MRTLLGWVARVVSTTERNQSAPGELAIVQSVKVRRGEEGYRFNRRFSFREMFPRFVHVALRTPPVPNRVLKLAENYA